MSLIEFQPKTILIAQVKDEFANFTISLQIELSVNLKSCQMLSQRKFKSRLINFVLPVKCIGCIELDRHSRDIRGEPKFQIITKFTLVFARLLKFL